MGITQNDSAERRTQAIKLAKTDTVGALAIARKIDDGWYRCQALAYVARYIADEDVAQIVSEAQQASREAGDSYKVAASSCWWLRALIERDQMDHVFEHTVALVSVAESIEHPVSKVEAQFLLLQAVFDVEDSRDYVLDAAISACRVANSWKSGSRLSYIAMMIAPYDSKKANAIVQSMREGPYKRRASRGIEGGIFAGPRGFFL